MKRIVILQININLHVHKIFFIFNFFFFFFFCCFGNADISWPIFSVDQFFECLDGMRSSQSALGSSGMWNWTCSVFSALTAASSLASGSFHIPSGMCTCFHKCVILCIHCCPNLRAAYAQSHHICCSSCNIMDITFFLHFHIKI